MLLACIGAFVVTTTLVACGVFAALSRAPDSAPEPQSNRQSERAAMAVVRAYFETLGQVGADGGGEPERLAPYVNESHASQLAVVFAGMRDEGWHTTGKTLILDDELIGRRVHDPPGTLELGVRVCLDVSRTRVIGPSGDDQTPSQRAKHVPFDVWLTTAGGPGERLVVRSTTMREELTPC
jgi:hypothetical protein